MSQLKPTVVMLALFTLVTGVVYPLLVTGISQVLMPGPANGSLIEVDGRSLGSSLIGQPFDDPKYFWGRLSGTGPFPYNAAVSSGSNYGPLNQSLVTNAQARIGALRQSDPENRAPVPVDLVTASGSGLDPHISVAAARYQVARVARQRGLAPSAVEQLVVEHTEGRQLGFFGEPRVNVLRLNLALDGNG